jgi:leucyl aminopeptidase
MHVEFVSEKAADAESALVLFAAAGPTLSAAGKEIDRAGGGLLSRAVAAARFKGTADEILDIVAPAGTAAARLVLIGLGDPDSLCANRIERAAAQAYAATRGTGVRSITFQMQEMAPPLAAHAGFALPLAAFRFDKYRTQARRDRRPTIAAARIASNDVAAARRAFAPLSAVAEGICLARELMCEPPNILFPESFAERLQSLAPLGIEVEILSEPEMLKLGMHALLAVGQGAAHPSKLVILRWQGSPESAEPPIALLGKGVCFDAGGISLKKPDGMADMKYDMGGAAAVAGTMLALAKRKSSANVIGILGLAENLPDGKASRPGDIVTSLSGKTIEIVDTDAEGRLILADALAYCQRRFRPGVMIDVATLTSSSIVGLGPDYAALMANDERLAAELLAAAEAANERLWLLPLHAGYRPLLKSAHADMKNMAGSLGGAITAALFLEEFVESRPWAHIDMAGVALKRPSDDPLVPEGPTGYGVRLLDRWISAREST